MGEEAPDMLSSPKKAELKPLCPFSIDDMAGDTPEKIEPKSVHVRVSNPSVEVRARYLDTSFGSCHDYCKYGHKNHNESISSFIAKQKKKMVVNSNPNSTIKRASSLSTPGTNCNSKYNDIILRNGVGVIQVSPMRGLISKGKKKESVQPNASLSPKPPIKKLSGKSQNAKDSKEVSRLKRHSSVEKGETKKPLNANNSENKKTGKALCFEDEKGKQKSPGAVTKRSSFVSPNALSKAKKKLDEISISKKKVELNSKPIVLGKKVVIEDKNDSAYKLAFKRGKVIDVKTNNSLPRRLKFKPRKVVAKDLNIKADDVAGSKTELAKKMTNLKVGVNIGRKKEISAHKLDFEKGKVIDVKTNNSVPRRLKFKPRKVVAKDLNIKADDVAGSKTELAKKMTNLKVGVNIGGKKEISAHKLDFERGKVIDVQPKNNAPRRLKFKPRKMIVENIKNENSRRNLKKVVGINEAKESNTEHLRVVLKHQNIEGKKDVQNSLNNVIEETATRLVRLRKSKVKALVGAFESLMSLPDAKSSTTSAS